MYVEEVLGRHYDKEGRYSSVVRGSSSEFTST
jgi:hypothetical protein